MTEQSNSAAERSAHVHRGDAPSPADWPVVKMPDGTWKLKSVVALEVRIAELEAALANARLDGMEAAAKWHDEQAAKAQKLSDMKVSAEDEKAWGDYAENHREYAAEIRAALAGGEDE